MSEHSKRATESAASTPNFLRRNFTLDQARAMWAQIDAATALAAASGKHMTSMTRRHSDGRLVPLYEVCGKSGCTA